MKPADPLMTPMQRELAQLRTERHRQERRQHRQRILVALVRDPALAIALLAAPHLERLRNKASACIQARDDAEFEGAAQLVLERQRADRERATQVAKAANQSIAATQARRAAAAAAMKE